MPVAKRPACFAESVAATATRLGLYSARATTAPGRFTIRFRARPGYLLCEVEATSHQMALRRFRQIARIC